MPGSAIVEQPGFTRNLVEVYNKAMAFVTDKKGRGAEMLAHAKKRKKDVVAEEYNRSLRVLTGKDMATVRKAVEVTAVVAGTAAALATSVIIYRHINNSEGEGKRPKKVKPRQTPRTK